jgi:hypothetical protein
VTCAVTLDDYILAGFECRKVLRRYDYFVRVAGRACDVISALFASGYITRGNDQYVPVIRADGRNNAAA